jgi:hypothetical protein
MNNPTNAPPIRDQVALVTGANAGMGLATARALLDAGYRVAATDLHTDQVARVLADFADRLACFTMDVSDVHTGDMRPATRSRPGSGASMSVSTTPVFCSTPTASRPPLRCGTRPCAPTSTACST